MIWCCLPLHTSGVFGKGMLLSVWWVEGGGARGMFSFSLIRESQHIFPRADKLCVFIATDICYQNVMGEGWTISDPWAMTRLIEFSFSLPSLSLSFFSVLLLLYPIPWQKNNKTFKKNMLTESNEFYRRRKPFSRRTQCLQCFCFGRKSTLLLYVNFKYQKWYLHSTRGAQSHHVIYYFKLSLEHFLCFVQWCHFSSCIMLLPFLSTPVVQPEITHQMVLIFFYK